MTEPTAILLWVLAIAMGVAAYLHPEKKLPEGLRNAAGILAVNLPRVAMALLSAGFLAEILPKALISQWLGAESGLRGILIASVVGGIIPGGPVVSFPVAVVLYKAGVHVPQLVALLTAWSVFALHRVLAYEIPMMGARFSLVRFGSSLVLPPLAGILAALLVWMLEGKLGL